MSDEFIRNSRRRLGKITFTPLLLPEGENDGGALQLAAAAGQLGLLHGEAAGARRAAGNDRGVGAALDAFEQLTASTAPDERLKASAALAHLSRDALTGAVALIRTERERALNQSVAQIQSATRRYQAAPSAAPVNAGSVGLSDRAVMVSQPFGGAFSALTDGVRSEATSTQAAGSASAVGAATDPELPPALAALLGPIIAPKALAALRWVDTNDPGLTTELLIGPALFIPAALRADARTMLLAGLPFLIDQLKKTADVKSHLTQRNLQPVGLLHLEQLVMTPVAIERGELLYTLPLAPGEKVTLSHKEWTLREEEYSRFVQDYLENYSERGVAQQTDIGMSSASETEHSKTLSMGKPMVPGAATIADPVNAQTTTEEVTREKQSEDKSRRETQEITQKASSLSVRDQKVSFTVSTVSGTEDFTSRLYENKSADKVMLVDYFRRMRRWQNNLYRTGIRMTYDVVLPDPGRILRERWLEVKALDDRLAAPFVFEYTPAAPGPSSALQAFASGAGFASLAKSVYAIPKFEFDSASPADLGQLARSYGATLPAAPNQIQSVERTHPVVEAPVRNDAFTFEVTVNIPQGYRVTRASIGGEATPNGDGDVWISAEFWSQRLDLPADGQFRAMVLNVSGKPPNTITGMFTSHKGAVGNVRVWADVEPTAETWRTWRDSAWTIIRQAAWTRYNENRDRLLQRRTALLSELQAPDVLALRRMEREQVMYLVLRWLFPDFDIGSLVYRDAAQQKAGSWQPALEYGEYIKFVHQAIDWDNALVILYPYFWDNPDNHAAKLYLNHPEAGHQEFLRAGAARVILAIRAGYEEELVSLLDKGHLGKLTDDSRFLPVIEKVRAANKRLSELLDAEMEVGAEDDAADDTSQPRLGERIGRWEDWTPTSALDMEVRLRAVVEEP